MLASCGGPRRQPASLHRSPQPRSVLEDADQRRAVIVALDLIGISSAQADRMRHLIATAVGASPDAVFLNCSHTHAGPHATEGSLRKLGGSMREIFDKERLYIESLPYEIRALPRWQRANLSR